MNRKTLVALTAAFAVLASSLPADAAQKRSAHYRRYAQRTYVRPAPFGLTPNYTQNWRWRDNYGWDNTCFNLPYLSSEFACSSHGR